MAVTLNTAPARNTNVRRMNTEESPYDGIWLNIGLKMDDGEGTEKFARLPRGIAVADLVPHKIYASTNPEWAEEAKAVNSLIAVLQKAGLDLDEGEARELKLSVQIYRRQEQVEQVETTSISEDDLTAAIFG